MTTQAVVNVKNEKVKDLEVADCLDARSRKGLVFEAVQRFLTNQRQGTVETKTRAEVRGGGKKPYKQKGTGNARHGSTRSPIFVGGGVAFGPHARDYEYKMPKQMRHAAMSSALSIKRRDGEMIVLDSWTVKTPKTKDAAAVLKTFGVKRALIVTDDTHGHNPLSLSLRNLRDIKVIPVAGLTVYDIIRYDRLIITEKALNQIVEVLS